MNAIDHTNHLVLEKEIKKTKTIKEGCLTWKEFLDFFFLKDKNSILPGVERFDWWLQIDTNGKRILPETGKETPRAITDLENKKNPKKSKLAKEEEDEAIYQRKKALENELREIEVTP